MSQQINNINILRRMNKDSQTILSKNKPQVRIIHLFAPEIIKTDPANFRELVQRLTGKPCSTQKRDVNKKKIIKSSTNLAARSDHGNYGSVDDRTKVDHHIVKREEAAEIWKSSASSSGGSGDHNNETTTTSGGFLTCFADIEDGFMQQLGYFQPCLDPIQNHNPLFMHQHNRYYTAQRHHHQQQQQQQHHFFGEEDHSTDHI